MMGRMLPVYAIFVLPPALVLWAVATGRLTDGVRRAWLIATIVLACGAFTLLRTDGVKGMGSQLTWRWSQTAEERLLAQTAKEPANSPCQRRRPHRHQRRKYPSARVRFLATSKPSNGRQPRESCGEPVAMPAVVKPAEWPGFRGPGRDGVVHGVQINTDWTTTPPVQIWHRPIGPGWSSFAVSGDLLYTQEQRGQDEIVACYRVGNGQPVWSHRDKVRFWESNGGAGLGRRRRSAADVSTRLARPGSERLDPERRRVWSRNVATDRMEVPTWGFSSSPLVLGDLVVVAASGKLAAYDIATGKSRWFGPDRPASYSSPHRATIDGIDQILLLTAAGATSVAPADGAVLWEHSWPEGSTIVQPALTADGDVLINTLTGTGGLGIRRLNVAHGSGGWTVTERWTSTGLKPYFNDFVVHKGHAYGFDGSILSCIDLQDGKRKWKGGRFGDRQLVLLADQDLLLVVSEEATSRS
jgi:outer membrane protein assembly factor BamB